MRTLTTVARKVAPICTVRTLRWYLVSSVGTWALVGSSEADHWMREVIAVDMVEADSPKDMAREVRAGVLYEADAELKWTMMGRWHR